MRTLALSILLSISTLAMADISDEIIFSLKSGNAPALAKHFNQNVELVVLKSDNVYSKAHAEQVMKDLVKKYKPTGYKKIHQGGKDGYSFMIGTLMAGKEKFRVYFLLKTRNNKQYIHQLRIETQNK